MAAIPQHLRPRPDEGFSEETSETLSNSGSEDGMQLDMAECEDGVLVQQTPVDGASHTGLKVASLVASLGSAEQRQLLSNLFQAFSVEQQHGE